MSAEEEPRIWWSRLVRDADGITGPAKAVCWFLADVADKNGTSWYSQEQIALKAGVTDRTVRRALADLVAMEIARRLSVDVRGDFRLADASKWRARLTRADLKDSALGRALFSFSSASTSNADQIAKTIAWLDDNPGHPFIVKVSDVPPPAV